MKPPRHFRILGQRYTVKIVPHSVRDAAMDDALGASATDARRVKLEAPSHNGLSDHHALEVFTHEALHCLIRAQGLQFLFSDDDAEEHLVKAVAPQLLDFLRSNPQVVEYLTQEMP